VRDREQSHVPLIGSQLPTDLIISRAHFSLARSSPDFGDPHFGFGTSYFVLADSVPFANDAASLFCSLPLTVLTKNGQSRLLSNLFL
jgi:hypothetical protein